MSMATSIEARVPFLDHHFIRQALSVPPHVKTRGGILKYILKKAVRNLIPDVIIDRKKQGFSVPIDDWIIDRLGDESRQILDDFCAKTDFLDFAGVDQIIKNGTANEVWYLLNFAMWWNQYIDEPSA